MNSNLSYMKSHLDGQILASEASRLQIGALNYNQWGGRHKLTFRHCFYVQMFTFLDYGPSLILILAQSWKFLFFCL